MKDGGFDAVIGNPPYVIITKDIFHKSVIDYYNKYEVAQYKTDLYHLFLERALNNLIKDGLLGYIVPNPWFTLKFTYKLRELILKNTIVEKIVKFDHKVFENADVHTALIFLRKGRVTDTHEISIKITSGSFNTYELYQASKQYVKQKNWLSDPEYRFELRQIGKKGDLVNRLVTEYPELEKVARASLGIQAYNSSKHTKEQIKNRVFHSYRKLSKEYLPELAGNDVNRYIIRRKKGQWIKYGSWLHDFRTMDWRPDGIVGRKNA
jgi:type I restriction-modification system DNA methylase subunit